MPTTPRFARPCSRILRLLVAFVAACLLAGCQAALGADLGGSLGAAPAYRASGVRLPAAGGVSPGASGKVKMDGLVWIDAAHQQAWQMGQIHSRGAYVDRSSAASTASATQAHVLRTDHVELYTNASATQGLEVAHAAQRHVELLFAQYAAALDLRFPGSPLRVVVTSGRAEFQSILRDRVRHDVGWGAFYDGRDGVVYVCLEPARAGALPWIADLRHEMTHQILDLSRPSSRRGRPFGAGWFWLWEGVAIHAESLGDPAGVDSGALRLARFDVRRARGEVTPWATLMQYRATDYEGRHYDQTASIMRFLMDPAAGRGRGRQGVIRLLGQLMEGPLQPEGFERAMGAGVASYEQAWRASLNR